MLPRRRLTMFIVSDWSVRMERTTRKKEKGIAKSCVIFGLRSCISVTWSGWIMKFLETDMLQDFSLQ